jgi:TetR/AcrR family transcriptional regulator, transcriptional repressor for nem operon
MSTKAASARSETAEEILDVAETLIQTRGYSAFSYQDIADALGIRKASIHYHFPSKTELGVAVINRYSERFRGVLGAIASDSGQSSISMFDHYVQPYLEFAKTPDKICLCGALGGEMTALPAVLRTRVDRFFKEHQLWLAGILERGVERGEMVLSARPSKMARLIFGALQGALIVKRTTGDLSQLRDVISVIRMQLSPAT